MNKFNFIIIIKFLKIFLLLFNKLNQYPIYYLVLYENITY